MSRFTVPKVREQQPFQDLPIQRRVKSNGMLRDKRVASINPIDYNVVNGGNPPVSLSHFTRNQVFRTHLAGDSRGNGYNCSYLCDNGQVRIGNWQDNILYTTRGASVYVDGCDRGVLTNPNVVMTFAEFQALCRAIPPAPSTQAPTGTVTTQPPPPLSVNDFSVLKMVRGVASPPMSINQFLSTECADLRTREGSSTPTCWVTCNDGKVGITNISPETDNPSYFLVKNFPNTTYTQGIAITDNPDCPPLQGGGRNYQYLSNAQYKQLCSQLVKPVTATPCPSPSSTIGMWSSESYAKADSTIKSYLNSKDHIEATKMHSIASKVLKTAQETPSLLPSVASKLSSASKAPLITQAPVAGAIDNTQAEIGVGIGGSLAGVVGIGAGIIGGVVAIHRWWTGTGSSTPAEEPIVKANDIEPVQTVSITTTV